MWAAVSATASPCCTTPIVDVVGANATYHQPNNPEHELINGHITVLARVVSHWAKEARNATELGELGAA
jgi:acetolactate synthase-1/2/3 large subunit